MTNKILEILRKMDMKNLTFLLLSSFDINKIDKVETFSWGWRFSSKTGQTWNICR